MTGSEVEARTEGAGTGATTSRSAAVGAWLVLAGACTALDGIVGLGVAVVVAAVLLARLPRRWLGVLGVAALALVPVVVLARGLPDRDEVSPFFVAGSLWPHHLAFAGIAWTMTWAVLDLRARLVATPPDPVVATPGRPPLPVAIALVVLVGALAVAAVVAVGRA